VITTVRRKQDYDLSKDSNGKTRVEKAGLKEETREGFEYELTANIELDIKHNATALKDRTGLFMDQPHFTPSEETGKKLLEWCENGTSTTAEKVELIKTKLNMEEIPAWVLTAEVKKEIHDLIKNSTLETARQTIAKKSLATCKNDKMVDHIRQALLKFQN
jgi:hypothetical protein